MAHKPLYTFSLLENRVLQFKRNSSIQIARLHSFSRNTSKNILTNAIAFHETLLACSSHTTEIVVVNIYTKRKNIITSKQHNINTLHFLNNNILVATDKNALVFVYDLKNNTQKEITTPIILALLHRRKNIDLNTLSYSILKPLIDENSLALAFDFIDNNPMLRGTTEHNKLQEMFRVVFTKALEELRKGNDNNAHKLLENFKDIHSKKEEINALLIDFKYFDRFKLHISEQKYAIAYALCSKHSLLKLTSEFHNMENIFNKAFKLAHEQMLTEQKNLARNTLSPYITILSKRERIKNLLSGNYSYNTTQEKSDAEIQSEKLLLAYEKSNFKECYELIDNYSLEGLELVALLEKHWVKLMIECENHALDGNVKAIKTLLGELISTKTRSEKIGDLLRVAFYSKIKMLEESRQFTSAENIIYSYIDIFGVDIEIKEIMKKFEKSSGNKLAITHNEKVLRSDWLNAALIVES